MKTAICGNHGDGIRSDCLVSLELNGDSGLLIDLESKVSRLYGRQITRLAEEVLAYFGIENAILEIRDSGAVDFVIAARIEAAIKKLIDTDKQWLPGFISENEDMSPGDRRRFSRLYLPGNTPKLMLNAGIHRPDGLILDLEDAVAPEKKHEARFLVRNTLRALHFYGAERMVRINQVPLGLEDLDYIVPHHVNLILVPKCESAEQIRLVNEKIGKIQQEQKEQRDIWLMPIIESALGVIKAYEIAIAADNVVAIAIGLEDYTADLGTRRSSEAKESFYARSMVVNAARAAGIQPIDSVFSDVSDMQALRENVLESKGLGFDGMGCIHPRQIPVIHDAFAPDLQEVEKARKIVIAFEEARDKGLGVVSIGSKMIDAPVVKRAQRTIRVALEAGKLNENWREEDENQ